MKASALKYAILSAAASLAMLIILLMPLHAVLSVWLSSIFGHYTAFRLWKEFLLLLLGLAAAYLLLFDTKIRSHALSRRIIWLILIYCIINAVWGLAALRRGLVTPKAFGYALIINLRFLIFFLITWALALRTGRLEKNWLRLLLWPAVVVVGFGLLQIFVLPHDFLRHLGYGPNTIEPYETINHNQHYIRIISTSRGANPLGAYLIIPMSLLAVFLLRGRRRWQYLVLLTGALITLYFSFSRSAWLGAGISIAVVLALSLRSRRTKQLALFGTVAGLLLIAVLAVGLRNSQHFQNIFLHTQTYSAVKTTSDQGHAAALKSGLHDLVREPLGRGPGTAGPASVYNNGSARIAENYFVQIGQETGWLGLTVFVLINLGVGYLLWLRRAQPYALALFAALLGITFVNCLSHAWADDTLAYVWWGLAGIVVAMPAAKAKADSKHEK